MYDIIATFHFNFAKLFFPVGKYAVFGARFNGNFVTFYKMIVSLDYLIEVESTLPRSTMLDVLRFPNSGPGLDILDPADRKIIIKSLVAIRSYMQHH
jgi:hypothetical protein